MKVIRTHISSENQSELENQRGKVKTSVTKKTSAAQ